MDDKEIPIEAGEETTSETAGHGGSRDGCGRKKGGKNASQKVIRLTATLPVPLWDALSEAAKQDRKSRRSRYIDLLIAAVFREDVKFDINPISLTPEQRKRWFWLTSTKGENRGGYFSLRRETWEDLEDCLKELQSAEAGWSRARLLREIFASQLILPPQERVRLDTLGRRRTPRQPPIFVPESPDDLISEDPVKDMQEVDDATVLSFKAEQDMLLQYEKFIEKIEKSNGPPKKIMLLWVKRRR